MVICTRREPRSVAHLFAAHILKKVCSSFSPELRLTCGCYNIFRMHSATPWVGEKIRLSPSWGGNGWRGCPTYMQTRTFYHRISFEKRKEWKCRLNLQHCNLHARLDCVRARFVGGVGWSAHHKIIWLLCTQVPWDQRYRKYTVGFRKF